MSAVWTAVTWTGASRVLTRWSCVCRSKGKGSSQLVDSVQLLESGGPGQCGLHVCSPCGPVFQAPPGPSRKAPWGPLPRCPPPPPNLTPSALPGTQCCRLKFSAAIPTPSSVSFRARVLLLGLLHSLCPTEVSWCRQQPMNVTWR